MIYDLCVPLTNSSVGTPNLCPGVMWGNPYRPVSAVILAVTYRGDHESRSGRQDQYVGKGVFKVRGRKAGRSQAIGLTKQ